MARFGKLFLICLITVAYSPGQVSMFGHDNFKGLDMYPVNVYNNRAIFYLDYDCHPSACHVACQMLEFPGGLCSAPITPNACICDTSPYELLLNSTVIYDKTGTIQTRVYQLGDWVLHPGMPCTNLSSDGSCEGRCRLRNFRYGICLKFTFRSTPSVLAAYPVCACKSRGDVESDMNSTVVAPFSPPREKQIILIDDNRIHLANYLCHKIGCMSTCQKFRLTNGECTQHMNRSTCTCDTGMEPSSRLELLNVKMHAGGIYTLNGWHIFEHDPVNQCNKTICETVCKLWDFPSPEDSACLQYEGIVNSCGCRLYNSTVPTEEDFANAMKSSGRSSLDWAFENAILLLGPSVLILILFS